MKKILLTILITILVSVTACGQAVTTPQGTPAPQAPPAPPTTHLKVGMPAPDFELTDTEGNKVKLSDFKGKKSVVLAFYVLAFTGG